MGITRDPDYPAEIAQLASALNGVCDGHSVSTVLNAGIQLVIAAIGTQARVSDASRERTEEYARHVSSCIIAGVVENYQRQPKPTDIPVKQS
jgi:hypothetical protein